MNWVQAGVTLIFLIAMSLTPNVEAQNLVENQNTDPDAVLRRSGLYLGSITAGLGYSSQVTTPSIGQDLSGLGGEGYAIGSISLGYRHFGHRTNFDVSYLPSYVQRFGFSHYSSFNQTLGVTLSHELNKKWDWSLGGSVEDSTIDQFLLNQPVTSTGVPALFPPSPTTTPVALLYGSRVLMMSGTTGLTGRPSTRWRLFFGAALNEIKGLNNNGPDISEGVGVVSAYPSTLSAEGMFTASYSLNPVSEIGVNTTVMNTRTDVGSYLTSTVLGTYSRKLNQHWSYLIGLGASASTLGDRRSEEAVEGTSTTLATYDSIQYERRTQRFVLAYSRVAGDSYGLGASSTDFWTGTWVVNRRNGTLSFEISSGFQHLTTGSEGTVDFVQLSSGVTRKMGERIWMELSYAYMKQLLGSGFVIPNQSIQTVRLTVSWNPFARHHHALTGGAVGVLGN